MKKLVICSAALVCLSASIHVGARDLSFDERVAAQKAIEQVYWNYRIWPKENPGPKPPLSLVMPDSTIRTKVEDSLRMSTLLASFWRQPITAEQLQAEITRMARQTKAPETLRELFAALHDDPFLIAECLARPTLAQRRIEAAFAGDERIHGAQRAALASKLTAVEDLSAFQRLDGDHAEITYILDDGAAAKRAPAHPADRAIHLNRVEWNRELGGLASDFGVVPADDLSAVPVGRASRLLDRGDSFVALAVVGTSATSVRVASVSWAKRAYGKWSRDAAGSSALDTTAIIPPAQGYSAPTLALGGCTDDTWTPTDTGANVANPRIFHTAVWTGSEMIVWGGSDGNTGGRYDPATDSWASSSLTTGSGANVPGYRLFYTAVWTGVEMIVWGGINSQDDDMATGGRYNPATDTWAASSLTAGSGANVPSARYNHTVIWTGSEMIVWGGQGAAGFQNTGGRYDPSTDTWAASSLTTASGASVPDARSGHTAVWTGSEMIVWGGSAGNTGGRYNPSTDTWASSSLTTGSGANVPKARADHTALWTGSEMIVWGGQGANEFLNTGGRYNPSTDTWASSSLTTGSGANVPTASHDYTAVWSGSEMIVWGGYAYPPGALNTGGRYNPYIDSWAASSLTDGSGESVPDARRLHTAVWTDAADHRMIVWGGFSASDVFLNTGGLYCAVCTPLTWYRDLDGDGYGNAAMPQRNCAKPPGYVVSGGDCNDADPAIHPGATEVCNGIDDDCDTVVDNGGNALCNDGDVCTADVCDPASGCPAIHKTYNIDATGFSATRVDGRDLVVLALAWNRCDPQPGYNPLADLDPVSTPPGACVDAADFHLFMNSFGHSCP